MTSRRKAPGDDAGPAPLVTKTAELKLRASPELKARIVAECERRSVSVSAWITWLAERELDAVTTSTPAPHFAPTHDFHLLDGTVVAVAAELRGDWVAYEADGTRWSTVMGDASPHWHCSARKVELLQRVIKYGHRFSVCSAPPSFRFECECGERGSWVRSDDRAADRGDRHPRSVALD